jgi:hypothetical protein
VHPDRQRPEAREHALALPVDRGRHEPVLAVLDRVEDEPAVRARPRRAGRGGRDERARDEREQADEATTRRHGHRLPGAGTAETPDHLRCSA